MERDFKGVFIPKEIWLNDELSAIEKMIFTEIDSLDGDTHCYASNEYLANFCKTSIPTVTRAISHLKLLGYIEEVSNNGRTRVLKSNLSLINLMSHPNQFDESDSSFCENLHYIENNKEYNIEAPAEPDALSVISSKRHNHVYKEKPTLTHDLDDGDKYIAEQKRERKKLSEEEKAIAKIDKTEFTDDVKELLKQFFTQSFYSKSDRRIKRASDLTGKIEKLRQLIKAGEDPIKVIQQSLDNSWNAFFEYKEKIVTNSTHEASEAIYKEPTAEELKAWRESDLHF